MKKSTVLMVLALCLAGCFPVKTTYFSEPQGAAVYIGGQMMGYAPVTVDHKFTDAENQAGRKIVPDVGAKWASGATVLLEGVILEKSEGYNQLFVLHRPDVPGREIDVAHAMELRRLEMEKYKADKEAQARRDEAYYNSLKKNYPSSSTTTIYGNTIQTTYY